ncbi:hypothetical protein LTR91_019977 [Friedmanniomyces endolithicus]|uniref:DNA 3'-5' helicase n=1 Tax=Friedmanniomyces endolithicus TaxID=329885 RepID=A0AAN6HCX2_9PEZI|nr:hypothetical protein LTR57_015600 [Friedmanniomyces endolithicus]KAK0961248.1 hypothetical protein LTR91_019977 [Friedmanniomyces endolithicus]
MDPDPVGTEKFTGWTVHLAGFTPTELLATIVPAAGEEEPETEHIGAPEEDREAAGLAEAYHATRRLIRQAFRVCRPQVVGRAALEYVNRRECGAENNEKPFYGEQQVKTVRKYSGHWVKILRYIWRTHAREHRPQYALSGKQCEQLAHLQAMAVQVIEHSNSIREQAKAKRQLVRRCLQFWLSMFDQPLKDCEFQSGIISGLAILGLDGQKDGWVPAVNYTPILAGIITTLRAMVVYQAYGIRQGVIQQHTSMGKTLIEAQMAAPSPMPLDRIFHQKTYGMKIRYTTKAPGQVLWEGERVTVSKAKFTVDHIRTVVHGLNESVRQRLKHELLWFPHDSRIQPGDWRPIDMPYVEIKALYDDYAEASQLIESSSGTDVRWKTSAVESYFRQVRRFKEELMVLVHLSAGAPARATELIGIQHRNGQHSQGQRGVFIQDGIVAFVTHYHKGYSASKRIKVVHRFFLREEPKPEEQWMEEEIDGGDEEGHKGEEGGEEQEAVQEWSEDEGDEWLLDVPPQREERAALNMDGFWDTDRVRRVMYRETEARIGVKIGVAVWRNAYPAIQRELCWEGGVKEVLDRIYDSSPQRSQIAAAMEQMQEIQARQSGHSRQMEEMIYGLLMSESPFSTMSEREQFRQVSVDWYRVLQFPSAWDEQPMDVDIARRVKQEQDKMQMERRQRMGRVDVQAELHKMYGPDARFRGVQQAALEAIVTGTPYVVVIMRTGGGKSMLFMLPAAGSPRGLTVVIVPVVSLRQDLHERCRKVGIHCAEWRGERPAYNSQIVLATPESAVSIAFSQFLAMKQANGQLERIIIDECHTMLECNADWRPKVLQLCEMAQQGVQVVYLTATLPPSEEAMFFQAIGVEERDVRVIRDKTSRPNVAYSVVPYQREQEDQVVQQLVNQKKAQYPEGQIIVYCKRVEQAKRVAKVLECSVYHRGAGNAEEKKAILQKLTGQKERVFTATNALGLGVDAPRIRVIIHVGIREQIKQYTQESGRAGRDGERSEAIVLQGTWIDQRTGQRKQEQGWQTEAAMREFLKGEQCRRVALDRHMDGKVDCSTCGINEERCDVCSGRPRGVKRRRIVVNNSPAQDKGEGAQAAGPRQAKQQQGLQQEQQQELEQEQQAAKSMRQRQEHARQRQHVSVEAIAQALKQWHGRCSICYASGQEADHTSWQQCPSPQRAVVQQAREAVTKVQFTKHAGCFWCKAPQAVCHQWEDISHGGPQRFRKMSGRQCQFPGVIQDAVAAIVVIGEGQVIPWIEAEANKAGVVGGEGVELWVRCQEWLGRKLVVDGIEMSGLCGVFWEFGMVAE